MNLQPEKWKCSGSPAHSRCKGLWFFFRRGCNSEARLCRLPQLTAAIELVTEISRQLNERKMEAVAEITRTFEELERALHQRKTALVTEMENICGTKQKVGGARCLFFFACAFPFNVSCRVRSAGTSAEWFPFSPSHCFLSFHLPECRSCRPSWPRSCKARSTSRAAAASQSRLSTTAAPPRWDPRI